MNLRELIGLMGLALLVHDGKDIGKIDRLHHWQLGATMFFKPDWFESIL